jgi:DNA-binding response OmpR family regulator
MNAVTPAVSTAAHILVVDDAEKNTRLLADLLTAKGYRTSTAASGEQALDLIRTDPPDLLLLDVMMPGMNGYEVCAALRGDPEHALLPIVLVTALDPATERVKGMAAGVDDFLSKPINQPELLARVKSLLRVKSLHDELHRQRAELQGWRERFEQRVSDEVTRRLQAGDTP